MPRFEPDFEGTRATTRIFPRGEYEISIKKAFGSSYVKDDGKQVTLVRLQPSMVGKYDAKGKLTREHEGDDLEQIRLYLHTEGALKMSKRNMMAILGFGRDDEDEFNQLFAEADFGLDIEEGEERLEVTLGEGWERLEGCNVKVSLDEDIYEPEDGEPVPQQNYKSFSPVGAGV